MIDAVNVYKTNIKKLQDRVKDKKIRMKNEDSVSSTKVKANKEAVNKLNTSIKTARDIGVKHRLIEQKEKMVNSNNRFIAARDRVKNTNNNEISRDNKSIESNKSIIESKRLKQNNVNSIRDTINKTKIATKYNR